MRMILLLIPIIVCGAFFFQPDLVRLMNRLGGGSVPTGLKDPEKAFLLAAEIGEASAMYNLGLLHARGEGAVKDYVRAYKWFNLASARRDADAVDARDRLARKMTPEQIAEAQRLSSEWELAHFT